MTHDPLRFCRPHRRACLCVTCKAVRAGSIHPWMTPAERRASAGPQGTPEDGQTVQTPDQGRRPRTPRPTPPRTPEDGQTVQTPEQGRRPMTRD